MIWADRLVISFGALMILLLITLPLWGVLDFYYVSSRAYALPPKKELLSDVDVGLASPAFMDWLILLGTSFLKLVPLLLLPLWIMLRIADFAFGGPAHRKRRKNAPPQSK